MTDSTQVGGKAAVRVAVIGAGRAGLATALTLTALGHDVVCTDVDELRVRKLVSGAVPFSEPQLREALAAAMATGRLRFIVSAGAETDTCEVAVLCVPTPSRGAEGRCDLSFLDRSIAELESVLRRDSIVVVKSTVPIGTCRGLAERFAARGVHVVANPEFLREGAIMHDSLHPSRIVLGGDVQPVSRVRALFADLGAEFVETTYESAELTKYAANCYLAVRYSFVNELAAFAAAVGARVNDVLGAMAFDPRIGHAGLRPGPGWGGPCLPKDSQALLNQAADNGMSLEVLQAAVSANSARTRLVVEQCGSLCGGSLEDSRIALWGLAFKADTDDARESPAIDIARELMTAGARCSAYDPAVSALDYPPGLEKAISPVQACEDADLLVVLTEWSEFSTVDLEHVCNTLKHPVIVDARGVLDSTKAAATGLRLVRLGERSVVAVDS